MKTAPARPVANAAAIAVDVGGTTVKGGLVLDGTILERAQRNTLAHAGGAMGAIESVVAELLSSCVLAGLTPAGIGVASPGNVDAETGRVRNAVNLGWEDEPVGSRLSRSFALPVRVDHDARAASRAAAAAVRAERVVAGPVLFIPIGTGISASLIIGDEPLAGTSGRAGEFGHIRIVPDGDACACGQRGCLEAYSSAGGILRRYRAHGGGGHSTTEQIVMARDSDPIARKVWHEAVEGLATGVATLTALFDPDIVLLGGGVSRAGDALLLPLRTGVTRALPWRPAPDIRVSALGADAGLIGAALLTQTVHAPSQIQEMK